MEHFLNEKDNIIHFNFEIPIIEDIKDLYLKYDPNIEVINKCYVQYYDEKKMNNKRYIFRGFYKDGYFIILIDIVDLKLDNIICHKNVLLTKLQWHLVKINDELIINKLNIKNNTKYQYFLMPIRNILNKNFDVYIDDLIFSNNKIISHLIINKKEFKNLFNIKALFTF
jgi:hypothetical protein